MKPLSTKKKPVVTKTTSKRSLKDSFLNFWVKSFNWMFADDVYYKLGGILICGLVLFLLVWALFTFVIKAPNALGDSMMVKKFFKPEMVKSFGSWAVEKFGDVNWKIFTKSYRVADLFNLWGNVLTLTLKYFFNHLVMVIPFILLLNLFKIGRWSMGMVYFALYTVLWGVVVGTNSMPFATGNNQIFGPLLLFIRYGIWTWFSYLLLVVSTTQFAWLTSPSWLNWGWQQERPKFWKVSFTPDQRELFIYGLLFLLAASFAEARIFVHYNLF